MRSGPTGERPAPRKRPPIFSLFPSPGSVPIRPLKCMACRFPIAPESGRHPEKKTPRRNGAKGARSGGAAARATDVRHRHTVYCNDIFSSVSSGTAWVLHPVFPGKNALSGQAPTRCREGFSGLTFPGQSARLFRPAFAPVRRRGKKRLSKTLGISSGFLR